MSTLKLNAPLAMPMNQIFEVFALVAKKSEFQIIEMEQTMATAVNKEPFSLKKMFLSCVPFQSREQRLNEGPENSITAIRL